MEKQEPDPDPKQDPESGPENHIEELDLRENYCQKRDIINNFQLESQTYR